MSKAPLTTAFAKAILSSDPVGDKGAMQAARVAIVDFLACAIGGAHDRSKRIVIDTLAAGSSGNAILIGYNRSVDPFTAALINAHSGHVLDFDDVHASVRGHPTTVIIPALLALAATEKLTAEAFIAAYITGLETMARLGLALGMKHYENGFHATATLGTIGVAAAVAHALKYSTHTTAVALGLAATQSAGLRLQFGYDAKPMHAGLAARAGLTAARLAANGFSGAADFLDNPIGFFSVFAFGQENAQRAVEDFGAPWQIVSPGLTLKAFPCCTASHPVAVAGLELREQGKLDATNIENVTITFPPGGDAALVVTKPATGIDARFSAEYVFATALIDGALTIGHFDERPVRDDLMQLAARVSRAHDESAPRLSSDLKTRFVILDIALKDGSSIRHRVDGLPGIKDPAGKFADATAGNAAFAEVPSLVGAMSSEADLVRLVEILGRASL